MKEEYNNFHINVYSALFYFICGTKYTISKKCIDGNQYNVNIFG